MNKRLDGKKVAVLVDQGFEEIELTEPINALQADGALPQIVSPQQGKVKSYRHDHWGEEFKVDVPLDRANPADYDALVLPGGVMNPDKLRMNDRAVRFVKAFVESGKPIAAICHGPWTLIETGMVKGRRLTSWPSLKTDLRHAGADWVDEKVVVDKGLVTSRKPDDLPDFNRKMCEEFAEGVHQPVGAGARTTTR